MKRDKVDDIFSKLIRERADWTCEACGKVYPEGCRQGLHCSHFFSRRHKATRWSADNAAAHCFFCHQRLGGNPVEFAIWIENYLGHGRLALLREKAHSIMKLSKFDKEDIYQHLKAEYSRVIELRKNGVTGRIEFTSPI